MSLWIFILKGGVVMIPILLGSVIGLAFVIERFYVFWKMRGDSKMLFVEIEELVKRGEIQMAIDACQKSSGPMSAIIKSGLKVYKDKGKEEDIDTAMLNEGSAQIMKMEKGLSALGVIVGIEPMLGFLGTIIGLIGAFMNWERLGANINVNILAGGMYQAMITTAAGLLVAIPYYVAYSWFMNKTQMYAKEMEIVHTKLLYLLGSSKKSVGSRDTII